MLKLKLQHFGSLMRRTDFIGKDPDSGKDWRQEEKGMTEDEMVGWHHQLNGREFEQAPRVADGQGSLACCSPWGHRESDTTERLNWKGSWDCFSTGSVAGNYGVPKVVSVSGRSLDGGIVVREPTHPAPSQPCIIPQGGHGGFPYSHQRFENGQAGYSLLIPKSIFHSSLLCSVLCEVDLYRLYHQGSLAGRDGFSQWEDQRQEEKEVGAFPHPLSFLESVATASTRGCSSRLPLSLGYNGLGAVATSSYCYSLGTAASLNLTQTWVSTHPWNSLLPARPLKVR